MQPYGPQGPKRMARDKKCVSKARRVFNFDELLETTMLDYFANMMKSDTMDTEAWHQRGDQGDHSIK